VDRAAPVIVALVVVVPTIAVRPDEPLAALVFLGAAELVRGRLRVVLTERMVGRLRGKNGASRHQDRGDPTNKQRSNRHACLPEWMNRGALGDRTLHAKSG